MEWEGDDVHEFVQSFNQRQDQLAIFNVIPSKIWISIKQHCEESMDACIYNKAALRLFFILATPKCYCAVVFCAVTLGSQVRAFVVISWNSHNFTFLYLIREDGWIFYRLLIKACHSRIYDRSPFLLSSGGGLGSPKTICTWRYRISFEWKCCGLINNGQL